MSRFSKDDWAQLSPLIDEALSLAPEARTEWLRRHKVSHPTIAGELEALLNRESALEAEGFLTAGHAPELPPMPGLVGTQLGAYTIESELGRGGMGSVWLARRTDGRFEGKAAVKFLSLAVAGPTGEARFRQEGSVLARLTHPNISRLLDAGVTPTGQPYLMLEYVDGRQLDVWCDSHRLDTEARIRLFLQVMAAVAHAHASLVVHRDIKPSNILVTNDGTAKLLDFGIARLLESGGTARQLTGTRDAIFTYQYAAPEQVNGDPISTATDVYSLGVVLYELLAGKHPTGERAQTPADHLRATLDTEPTPLSHHKRELAGDLDNILAKALRKEPSQRYATVTAFADDLQRYLNHEPVTARPTTWGYRAGKFVRRHRGSVGTAILTLILLIGAAVVTTLQAREARIQRDVARHQVRRLFAQATMQSIMVSNDRGPNGREYSFTEKVARAVRLLRAEFGDQPWLVAEVMAELATRFGPDQLDDYLKLTGDAQEIARDAGAWQQLAFASCERVAAWLFIPDMDSARRDLDEGLAALARAEGIVDIENRMVCGKAKAEFLAAEGKFDSALVESAEALRLSAPTSDGEEVSGKGNRFSMIGAHARVLQQAGRLRESNDAYIQLLREMDESGRAVGEEFSGVVANVNYGLNIAGEHALTDSILSAVSLKQEALNGTDGTSNAIRFLLGTVKLRLGLVDSAVPILEKAIADTTEGQGGISWWVPNLMSQLRLEQGRVAEAEAYLAQYRNTSAVAMLNRITLQARLLHARGDRAGASALLERHLGEWVANSALRYNVPYPLVIAGEWRLAAGDPATADSLAQLAIANGSIDSVGATRSSIVGRAQLLSARALAAQGRMPQAREAAERAVVATRNGYGPTRSMAVAAAELRDSL